MTLSHDGEPRIERGFVRREDIPAAEAKQPREAKEATPALIGHADRGIDRASDAGATQRLAQAPDVALVAVVHAVAASVFYPLRGRSSCLHLAPRVAHLGSHVQGYRRDDACAGNRGAARALGQDPSRNAADLWPLSPR